MRSLILISLLLTGCAGTKTCPDEFEPVSACRAERACGKGSFGLIFGTILSGMGSGLAHQPNATTENYNECVRRNLASQEYNAKVEAEK